MLDNDWFALGRFFWISLGAVPGALIRWFINNDLHANILGSAVMGLVIGLNAKRRFQFIFSIGFCGACTSFSSWITKIIDLIVSGLFSLAITAIGLTIFWGGLSLYAGFLMGRRIKESIAPR